MKKLLMSLVVAIGCSSYASAQVEKDMENPTEDAQERLQQEPPVPTQARNETAARQSATIDEQNKKQVEIERKKKEREAVQKAAAKANRDKAKTQKPVNQKVKSR